MSPKTTAAAAVATAPRNHQTGIVLVLTATGAPTAAENQDSNSASYRRHRRRHPPHYLRRHRWTGQMTVTNAIKINPAAEAGCWTY